MNITYDEHCRILGDLYLSAKDQENQFKKLLTDLNEQIAVLKKENRTLREKCNTTNENISSIE